MKNWKLIALDALEVAFRPLVKTIPDDVEPAVSFYVFPESAR
jgi:hypothetical protein